MIYIINLPFIRRVYNTPVRILENVLIIIYGRGSYYYILLVFVQCVYIRIIPPCMGRVAYASYGSIHSHIILIKFTVQRFHIHL